MALFNAGVPEKLILYGMLWGTAPMHFSYMRPSVQQRQGVSKFLVQGAHQTVEKENIPTKRNDPVNPLLLLLDGHSTHYNSH